MAVAVHFLLSQKPQYDQIERCPHLSPSFTNIDPCSQSIHESKVVHKHELEFPYPSHFTARVSSAPKWFCPATALVLASLPLRLALHSRYTIASTISSFLLRSDCQHRNRNNWSRIFRTPPTITTLKPSPPLLEAPQATHTLPT